ncbi:MAG: hypothetical protein ACOVLE_04890 [Pirellula staleyi]
MMETSQLIDGPLGAELVTLRRGAGKQVLSVTIWLIEWAGDLLGSERLAGSHVITAAPACQTGAGWY